MNGFQSIPKAIAEIKAGNMLVIVDDPTRENQGDLFIPAAMADTQKLNFMIKECRGLVCAPLSREFALRLDLPLMVEPLLNTEKHHCNFTVSVDAKTVTSFGISAGDRTKTVEALANPKSLATDFVRPGHIFPLLADDGGILQRAGHTEAAVLLTELAGFSPCGVICEILNDDGEPARLPDLKRFAQKHNISVISIADLIEYQQSLARKPAKPGKTLVSVAHANLPTIYGLFELFAYKTIFDNREHVALVYGTRKSSTEPMLTRVHSQCFTGDTLSSLRCDCNEQLHMSMKMIQQKGRGVLVYLNQEGRGIGLGNKIKAYNLQDQGYDTVEANQLLGLPTDARNYQVAADILDELGIDRIDLLTNNPEKEKQLSDLGVRIQRTISLETPPNAVNVDYLITKKHKLGHRLTSI